MTSHGDIITTPTSSARGSPTGRRWLLGRQVRRATLAMLVVTAGAWVGIDVIVGILVLTGWSSDGLAFRDVAYQALARFLLWPMLASGLVWLVTGLASVQRGRDAEGRSMPPAGGGPAR